MDWWQTLLMGGASCLITLVVTFIFNWITNRPKLKREQEEKERKKREEEQARFRAEVKADVQAIKDETLKQNDDCKHDHQCLAKIVGEIQQTNKAQNFGLQSVLKDLLKIRYCEWIKKGYAPMDVRDDLEHMFQAYEKLGQNGVMNKLRNTFLELPLEKPVKGRHHNSHSSN